MTNQMTPFRMGGLLVLTAVVLATTLPPASRLSLQVANEAPNNNAPMFALAGFSFLGIGRRKFDQVAEDDATRIKRLEAQNTKLSNQLKEARNDIADLNAELETFRKIQAASLRRFQTLFNELPLPCFTVNEIGNIVEWNRAAESFFGLKAHQVVDQPLNYVLGEDVYRGHAQDNIYQVFLGHQPEPAAVRVKPRNSAARTVKWFTSPVKDTDGRIVGAVNTLGVLPTTATAQAAKDEVAA